MKRIKRLVIGGNLNRDTNQGIIRKLILKGIGFKSGIIKLDLIGKNTRLFLDLGFSHYFFFDIPQGVNIFTKKYEIYLYSKEKVLLTALAERLVKLRKPDAYKGKGILYEGQELRLKKGKQR